MSKSRSFTSALFCLYFCIELSVHETYLQQKQDITNKQANKPIYVLNKCVLFLLFILSIIVRTKNIHIHTHIFVVVVVVVVTWRPLNSKKMCICIDKNKQKPLLFFSNHFSVFFNQIVIK